MDLGSSIPRIRSYNQAVKRAMARTEMSGYSR